MARGSDRKDPPHTRFHGRVEANGRMCAEPGCEEPGEFRAPPLEGASDGGSGPGAFRWMCLEHVRAFNSRYNYFDGMTADEIHRAQRPLAGWESETRAFARAGTGDQGPRWADFRDPLDAINARARAFREQVRPAGPPLTPEQSRAFETLGLAPDADRKALRTRYSQLVRRYHPDRNGGDRSLEARLQAVVEAYNLLKSSALFA